MSYSDGAPVQLIKLNPGDDVSEALGHQCEMLGWERSIILSAVGSLIDANIIYGSGDDQIKLHIPGPGLEVASLSGQWSTQNGPCVSGIVCDQHGDVAGGLFVRGENRVCITFELAMINASATTEVKTR